MRRTLTFTEEGEKSINDWRRKQPKIPSFNQAVNKLIYMGLVASDWSEELDRREKAKEVEKK